MREIEIIINEDAEIVSVNDFFTFSVKYHNLSSAADAIHESDKLIVNWSTTGIWLIDDNELYIKGERDWRDVSKDLSFFLEWQNPDSIHSPISLKMLFHAIVDSLKHDYWKAPFGEYQEHSIRISEIAKHYSEKALQEERISIQDETAKIIHKNLKKDFINIIKKKQKPEPVRTEKELLESVRRLNSLKPENGIPDIKNAEVFFKRKQGISYKLSQGIEHFANKNWTELPNDVKLLLLQNYEMTDDDMKRCWDGINVCDRIIILFYAIYE